jgi:hypothetical protein
LESKKGERARALELALRDRLAEERRKAGEANGEAKYNPSSLFTDHLRHIEIDQLLLLAETSRCSHDDVIAVSRLWLNPSLNTGLSDKSRSFQSEGGANKRHLTVGDFNYAGFNPQHLPRDGTFRIARNKQ